jgi:acyl-homoserine lactone acylase PvdQ
MHHAEICCSDCHLALTATAAMAEALLKVRVYQADGASFNVTST